MSGGRKLTLVILGAAAAASLAFIPVSRAVNAGPEIVVFRSPSCACCGSWAGTLERAGFRVHEVTASDLQQVNDDAGVPAALRACHTARVGHYVIEGHVPASAIRRLLAEHPDVAGLAVAGMPAGAPGMTDAEPRHFTVYSFKRNGAAKVFEQY